MVYNIPVMTETNRPTLTHADEAVAQFCETGAVTIAMSWHFDSCNTAMELLAKACAAPITPNSPRVASGYLPKPLRVAKDASDYATGFKFAPARETAADKALAEAQRWGLAS